jgi:hypothetical protein
VNRRSRLFLVEVVLAALSAALFVASFVWRDWIEIVTEGGGGDGGNGLLEWALSGGAALAAVVLSVTARSEWRRGRGSARPEPAS